MSCPLVNACEFNGALAEALEAFFTVLRSYTIADVSDSRKSMRNRLGLYALLVGGALAH